MSGLGCLASDIIAGGARIDAAQNESSVCADIPEWQEGQWYDAGAIVNYQGSAYIAEYDNPGYIPTVSTYYLGAVFRLQRAAPQAHRAPPSSHPEPTEPTEGLVRLSAMAGGSVV